MGLLGPTIKVLRINQQTTNCQVTPKWARPDRTINNKELFLDSPYFEDNGVIWIRAADAAYPFAFLPGNIGSES